VSGNQSINNQGVVMIKSIKKALLVKREHWWRRWV